MTLYGRGIMGMSYTIRRGAGQRNGHLRTPTTQRTVGSKVNVMIKGRALPAYARANSWRGA